MKITRVDTRQGLVEVFVQDPFPMKLLFQEMDGEMRTVLITTFAENPDWRIDPAIRKRAKYRAIQALKSHLKREARRTVSVATQLRLFV